MIQEKVTHMHNIDANPFVYNTVNWSAFASQKRNKRP